VATDQAVLPKNDFGKALRFWYPQRQIMNAPLLKQNCKLVVVLGALFLVPGLSIAGVIGSLPYTITTSGNYELESNLTYAGHGNAIEVNTDDRSAQAQLPLSLAITLRIADTVWL
jgi:hypothetical protein